MKEHQIIIAVIITVLIFAIGLSVTIVTLDEKYQLKIPNEICASYGLNITDSEYLAFEAHPCFECGGKFRFCMDGLNCTMFDKYNRCIKQKPLYVRVDNETNV